jgi:hypothetical protein
MVTQADRRGLGSLLLVLIALTLPLIPIPGDASSRMEVQFRTQGMHRVHSFTARLPHSVCTVIASAVAFEDPKSGDFTTITCAP